MAGIRDGGVWKEIRKVYIKDSFWKEVKEIYQKYNGSWRLIWEPPAKFIISGTLQEVNLNDGSYIVSGLNDITLTATGDFVAEVVMWGEGSDDAQGGFSSGIVTFKKGFKYRVVTGYGGGAKNSLYTNSARGGGYSGLFEGSEISVSITQTQALMIAGGAGGGGTSTYVGGGGGGLEGSNGSDAPGIVGGSGGTQSSGPGGAFKGQSSGDGSAGGEATYTSVGSHTWTCPAGVTSVSVVCIGGGCSGAGGLYSPNRAIGGGGAGLIYANNVPVTPGTNYTVFVGRGGQAPSGTLNGSIQEHSFIVGQSSYFRKDSSNNIQADGASSSSGAGASRTGFTGATSVARSGGSGQGGIINDNGTGYGGLGGGAADYNTNGVSNRGIYNRDHTYAGTGVYGLDLGNYGGGGGGSDYTWSPGKSGQDGAVRIIWGSNTSFPSQAGIIPPKYSGGGAGYYGGGCGNISGSTASGSGGGSGFIKSSVSTPKSTTTFSGSSDPDRGTAGDTNYGPARVVIRLLE